MKLSSKPTQEAFARYPWLKVGSLVGVSFLLIASMFGVLKASSLPTKMEQPTTVANYEHTGEFDYLVYLKSNSLYGPMQTEDGTQTTEEAEQLSMVFFRNIIDDARLGFNYDFSCSQSLSSITNEVIVTVIAENPDMWQKEITILEKTYEGGDFRVAFPLFPLLDSVKRVVDDIEEEIGISTYQDQFIIRAMVHTTAETAMGTIIEDDFSHEITAIIQTYTLTLDGSLTRSDINSRDNISYSEEGWFDYVVYLKPNELYEEDVLRSEGPPEAESSSPLKALGPGLVYFPKIIDSVEANFSYGFACDTLVGNVTEEVEVVALLEYPGMWSKSFTLVPKTSKSGPFVVDFPVDIKSFESVTNTLRSELGFGAATYDLTIQAVVHTTGDTASGHIDEVFTHSLQGQLGVTTFTLEGDLDKQQPGAIVENRMVPVGKTTVFRVLSLVGLALAVFAFLFVLRNSRQARAVAISRMEEEVLGAKRKHKGVIVDVVELPPTGLGEVIIPIGSVDELVKTSDALLKPVLHQAEADKHTYCVIDGAIRYQYISQPEDSGS
jgi:hypothetical protein